jgi:vancomycin resistance protein YoaR
MSSIPYPVHSPRSRFSIEQALLAILMGMLLFGVSLAFFIVGTQVWFAGRIFPGVHVGGIDIGSMRPQDAALKITQQYTYPTQGKILLRDGNKIWVATPAQLGYYLDPTNTAQRAYQIGRSDWLLGSIQSQFYTWYSGQDVAPEIVFDQRAAYAYLNQLAAEINKPAVEATLELNGTEVHALPGQTGRTLEISQTLALVSQQLQTSRDGVINLVVAENTPVIIDATQQADLARNILKEPLNLTLPEQDKDSSVGPWAIDPQTLAGMITFERTQAQTGAQYEVKLKEDLLRAYLVNLAPSLSRAPQNARFTFNDDSHQLDLLQSATIGRELDIDNSIKAIQEKLYGGEHSISLAMTYTNPPVTDQSTGEQLGITQLVNSETSYFYGSSASRVQNIQTAAAKFHGLMVAPGETFSMASALGDITLDNGYAEASIILGGQTIKGVGGGVCQVSTTLFRTAFFAGFPIVERHAHAYRVYYYEKVSGNRIDSKLAGLDATVFVPLVDFKFTNDTPYWLLMETYVNPDASSITWKFYSTSDGRTVDWNTTGPTNIVNAPDPVYRENPDLPSGTIKQVDWAADGADVTVNRTVNRNGSVYLQDTVNTHYEPWADTYEYGPGTELPDKSSEESSDH